MVCIYCGHKTQIVNSRLQRRTNSVWRRRECPECKTIFTSIEEADKNSTIRVESGGKLAPYNHEKLFISIYDSCRHRPTAIDDAKALTNTIFNKLLNTYSRQGIILVGDIKIVTAETLKHFDRAAMVYYQAYFMN